MNTNDLKKKIERLTEAQRLQLLDKLKSSKQTKAVPMSKTLHNHDAMKFGLFFFSDNGTHDQRQLYQLLIDSAKFADKERFNSLWTPERHFNEFGGPYPAPAILASALAMVSEHIQLRAGSVVLPLHHPVRVAEEWAVVDNLSFGRVGLSVASGWHRDDFILSQHTHQQRKEAMEDSITKLREVWQGKPVSFTTVDGHEVSPNVYPKPVQKDLPLWMTSVGNIDTWKLAGRLGTHVLTGLMEQSIEELQEKIAIYHETLAENGFDPTHFEVAVMMHTYLGNDMASVEATVKPPLLDYFRSHLKMYEKHLKSTTDKHLQIDLNFVSENDKETLIQRGFDRYFNTCSLLGTPSHCLATVERLKKCGVTEIACLINFGLDYDTIMQGLTHLGTLKSIHESRQKNAVLETELA